MGPLPPARHFAGTELKEWIPGGSLYSCSVCAFVFRSPIPAPDILDELYQLAPSRAWQYNLTDRIDWTRVLEDLNDRGGPLCVLDVGCFDGAFLEYVDSRHGRFGIELNADAALRAAERGVHIIAGTADALASQPRSYDAITAFDVFEHLPDPRRFIENACLALRPGGSLYIATGNTNSRTWRFMKNRYWYCATPEHLGFLNPAWARYVAAECGVTLSVMARYSHEANEPIPTRVAQLAKNLVMKLIPSVFAAMRLRGLGGKSVRNVEQAMYPPHWGSARDHILLKFSAP